MSVRNNKVMIIDTLDGQHVCLEVFKSVLDDDRGEQVVTGCDLLTGEYVAICESQIKNKEVVNVNF